MRPLSGWMILSLLIAVSPALAETPAEPLLPPGGVEPIPLFEPIEDFPPCYPYYAACTPIEDGEEVRQKPSGACIHICYTIYECYDVACGEPYPIFPRAEERENMGVYPRGACPGMPDGPAELPLCRRPPPPAG